MPLLNYTTKISVDKTIGEIQKSLATHGATGIYTDIDGQGMITALVFRIRVQDQDISFKLPNDYEAVLKVMQGDRKIPNSQKTKEQALRVSWRILKVWIDAQMALIETKMVKTEQVFLPYAIWKDGKTVYESLVGEGKGLMYNP